MGRLTVRRISYALGAEITGVDLREPLDDETVAEIRKAWLDNLLLCFPGQDIDGHQMAAFAARFGEVIRDAANLGSGTDATNPYVTFLSNKPVINGKPWSGYRSGQEWHSDLSYSNHPSPATFVVSKTLPDVGGNTMFANMYLAYETLSPAMKAIVDPLSAIHDWANTPNVGKRGADVVAQMRRKYPPIVHPVVLTHPETGRKALYVAPSRVRQIVGMTDEESLPLLNFLCENAVRYESTYRHVWKPNDLIMWDNRCLLHRVVFDYDTRQTRHLLRCALAGPKAGYCYTGTDYAEKEPPVVRELVLSTP